MIAGTEEILREFIAESREGLGNFEDLLLGFEEGEINEDSVHALFRVLHTIKGSCGFLGLANLAELAHSGEALLEAMRSQSRTLDGPTVDLLLELARALRASLDAIEGGNELAASEHSALKSSLLAQAKAPGGREAAQPAPGSPANDDTSDGPNQPKDHFVRLDVRLLDRLMNLVGELVLTRNKLVKEGLEESERRDGVQRLNVLTTQLQEVTMHTRMQPVSGLWRTMRHLVRQTAQRCNKQVHLVASGQDTELDKSLLESIKDPLTHLLRNAIDHGIESAEERARLGKSAQGWIELRASHEGGVVNIEVRDDGAGIDTRKLKSKAVEKGLLRADAAEMLSEDDALQLVFHPGLSTTDEVSDISGRGVGMDVVRANIERLGGQIEIRSARRRGTSFHIHIPLTLAIVPAQIVRCGDFAFAIPRAHVVELLSADAVRDSLRESSGVKALELRGQLLPVIELADYLNIELDNSGSRIALLRAGDHNLALCVDTVGDCEEIVVKPLPDELRDLNIYSGVSLLGDGRIAFILDVLDLARHARLSDHRNAELAAPTIVLSNTEHIEEYLVIRSGDRHVAISVNEVQRVERFDSRELQWIESGPILSRSRHKWLIEPLIAGDVIDPNSRDEDFESWLAIVPRGKENGRAYAVRGQVDVCSDPGRTHCEDQELFELEGQIVEILRGVLKQ